jgi:hypothetical protein
MVRRRATSTTLPRMKYTQLSPRMDRTTDTT